jgi:hypothetical protein
VLTISGTTTASAPLAYDPITERFSRWPGLNACLHYLAIRSYESCFWIFVRKTSRGNRLRPDCGIFCIPAYRAAYDTPRNYWLLVYHCSVSDADRYTYQTPTGLSWNNRYRLLGLHIASVEEKCRDSGFSVPDNWAS